MVSQGCCSSAIQQLFINMYFKHGKFLLKIPSFLMSLNMFISYFFINNNYAKDIGGCS